MILALLLTFTAFFFLREILSIAFDAAENKWHAKTDERWVANRINRQ